MRSELEEFQLMFHSKPERAQPEILEPFSSAKMPAGRILEKVPISKDPSICEKT